MIGKEELELVVASIEKAVATALVAISTTKQVEVSVITAAPMVVSFKIIHNTASQLVVGEAVSAILSGSMVPAHHVVPKDAFSLIPTGECTGTKGASVFRSSTNIASN